MASERDPQPGVRRGAAIVALALATLAGCHPATPPAVGPVTTEGLVQAGAASLHVHCVGQGGPLVVLESGLGDDATVWDHVQPAVARFVHVCAYDRAGLGRSGPASRPHPNRQMADELFALLGALGFAGPYVLVGHSMGGTVIRLFAAEHPDDVGGMVLVDTPTKDDWLRGFALHSAAAQGQFKAGVSALPEGVDFDTLAAGAADMEASSRSIGDAPLVVLTRGREPSPPPPGVSPETEAAVAVVHRETQPELLRLSSNSVQVVAAHSGHYLQLEVPELVVAAVREAVEAARDRRRVDGTGLSAIAGATRPAPTPAPESLIIDWYSTCASCSLVRQVLPSFSFMKARYSGAPGNFTLSAVLARKGPPSQGSPGRRVVQHAHQSPATVGLAATKLSQKSQLALSSPVPAVMEVSRFRF